MEGRTFWNCERSENILKRDGLKMFFRLNAGFIKTYLVIVGIVFRRGMGMMTLLVQPGVGGMQVDGMGNALELVRMEMAFMLVRL